MDIYHNFEIQNSKEIIWKQLCSLENLEKYLLIVKKSRIDTTGNAQKEFQKSTLVTKFIKSKKLSKIQMRQIIHLQL